MLPLTGCIYKNNRDFYLIILLFINSVTFPYIIVILVCCYSDLPAFNCFYTGNRLKTVNYSANWNNSA